MKNEIDRERRKFLRTAFIMSSAVALRVENESNGEISNEKKNSLGVLMDIPFCIGCGECVKACRETHNLISYSRSINTPSPEGFKWLDEKNLTVINRFEFKCEKKNDCNSTAFVKFQCMHCLYPSCVSACPVGALTKADNGAVIYDKKRCIGCRYCMIACPFQVPAYEYNVALKPQVRKCDFCFDLLSRGKPPACVSACPMEALAFDERRKLLAYSHRRLCKKSRNYVKKVYGENEVGGTSFLYISHVPFEKSGFLTLSETPPSKLSEKIQHSIFKYFSGPVGLFSLLAVASFIFSRLGRKTE